MPVAMYSSANFCCLTFNLLIFHHHLLNKF
nr:MAG TPA: hypothetical protein [Bacteriophage sp.]